MSILRIKNDKSYNYFYNVSPDFFFSARAKWDPLEGVAKMVLMGVR